MGLTNFRQAQIVIAEIRRQTRLTVSGELRARPRDVGPFSETRLPPDVVLGYRMELRQVERHDVHARMSRRWGFLTSELVAACKNGTHSGVAAHEPGQALNGSSGEVSDGGRIKISRRQFKRGEGPEQEGAYPSNKLLRELKNSPTLPRRPACRSVC